VVISFFIFDCIKVLIFAPMCVIISMLWVFFYISIER